MSKTVLDVTPKIAGASKMQSSQSSDDDAIRDWAESVAPKSPFERRGMVATKAETLVGIIYDTIEESLACCHEAVEAARERLKKQTGGMSATANAIAAQERPVRFYTLPELPEVRHSEIEMILPDFIARTLITQLTGPPKEGKSTFLAALAAAVAAGRVFIGRQTTKTRVLYFTEENAATFLELMRRVCAQDEDNIHVLLRSEVFGRTWAEVCELLRDYCRKNDIGLLIVDTFTDLAGLAGEDENVSGPVLAALLQLRPIAADGVAVVIVRHDRKEGGSLVQRARGSSAFAGAVDILMGIRRCGETQREINAEGRIDGIPESLHVDFDGIEYAVAMDPKAQRDLAFERRVLAILPRSESEAIGIEAVVAKLDSSRPTVRKMLKRLKDEGAVFAGRGKGRVTAAQAVGWWAP